MLQAKTQHIIVTALIHPTNTRHASFLCNAISANASPPLGRGFEALGEHKGAIITPWTAWRRLVVIPTFILPHYSNIKKERNII